jgi:hypothetical protein
MGHKSSERGWEAEPEASFVRRLGKSPKGIKMAGGDEYSKHEGGCPDIWELSNGDVAIIGRDLTDAYMGRLPREVSVAEDERVIVLPGVMLSMTRGIFLMLERVRDTPGIILSLDEYWPDSSLIGARCSVG